MSLFGAKPAVQQDYEVPQIQDDSISGLSWSSKADLLAVSSWNNEVRIFEVANNTAQGKALYSHQGPVLSVHWSTDGSKVVSGGADNAGRIYDLQSGQAVQFAQHDAPIKAVKYFDMNGQGLVATGSWDKTIKYWDMRQQQPVATVNLPDRVYAMDVVAPLLVVGCAERHLAIINLTNPTQLFKTFLSPLKMQTRAVSCFPDATGYALGSIEGRIAIQFVDDSKQSGNFSFKCHRKETKVSAFKSSSEVWAINAISFHPLGTFSTAGSDGVLNIWHHESRTRLKTFDAQPGPIAATAFSAQGDKLAYAVSYDWHKGHAGNSNQPNKVMIHPIQPDEVKPRQKK